MDNTQELNGDFNNHILKLREDMEKNLILIRQDIKEMKNDIKQLKTDVSELILEFETLKLKSYAHSSQFSSLDSEIRYLKNKML